MKKTLFTTTAAIAMLAGVHFVNAQAGGGAAGGAGGDAGMSQGSAGGSGSMGGSGATQTQRGSGSEMQRGGQMGGAGESTRGSGGQAHPAGTTASEKQTPGANGQRNAQQPSRSGTQTGQSSQSRETTGSAPSGTRVTAEQKTKIKSHMGELRAGRVSNVNFSIAVGTVVPRSVELHVLPAPIVEIVPAYRGYKYIVVNDEILIIDPNTLRIVAVIEA